MFVREFLQGVVRWQHCEPFVDHVVKQDAFLSHGRAIKQRRVASFCLSPSPKSF